MRGDAIALAERAGPHSHCCVRALVLMSFDALRFRNNARVAVADLSGRGDRNGAATGGVEIHLLSRVAPKA